MVSYVYSFYIGIWGIGFWVLIFYNRLFSNKAISFSINLSYKKKIDKAGFKNIILLAIILSFKEF